MKEKGQAEVWISVILIVISLVVWGFVVKYTCDAKTKRMGFEHSWGPVQGCLIEVKPNQWIPLESYYFKQE